MIWVKQVAKLGQEWEATSPLSHAILPACLSVKRACYQVIAPFSWNWKHNPVTTPIAVLLRGWNLEGLALPSHRHREGKLLKHPLSRVPSKSTLCVCGISVPVLRVLVQIKARAWNGAVRPHLAHTIPVLSQDRAPLPLWTQAETSQLFPAPTPLI